LTIRPQMFTPTLKSTNHWEKALKSHITQVILRYIATAMDTCAGFEPSPLTNLRGSAGSLLGNH
ncbi:hypothetical protein MJO29_014067, partial [Puccinia striiformis f. sp. tritici]